MLDPTTKEVFIMRCVKIMKAAKIGYIVMSLVFVAFGILLILKPKELAPVVAGVFGVLLILFGAVKLVGYFSRDLFRLAFQYDLAFGVFLIVLGVITILRTDHVMVFMGVVLGVYVLADGLLKIQIALDARAFGIRKWWLILTAAILAGAAGSFLIFRPMESAGILVILLGICLLADGVLSLVTVLTAVKIIEHQQPDRIDVVEFHM